jgi:hypothetical protein
LRTLNRATGLVVVRATSAISLVAVVDAEGGVGGLDDHGAPGEADADTDLSRRSRDGTPAGRPTCEDFLYGFKPGQRAASGRPRPAAPTLPGRFSLAGVFLYRMGRFL